jgi:hypothetical protein
MGTGGGQEIWNMLDIFERNALQWDRVNNNNFLE